MHIYRVAQRLLAIDPALPELALRRVDEFASSSSRSEGSLPELRQSSDDEAVFRGDGLLGPAERHIECRWSPRGYSLYVDGVGHFRITEDGRRISRSDSPDSSTSSELLTETVLGPAMTLALALQGVWCLHASAVETRGGVVAFLGSSGAGKSTLGRELPKLDLDLHCAADDVLPIALDGTGVCEGAARALPHFPQLKYQLEHQPGDALPANLPLRRIYVLDPIHDVKTSTETSVFVKPLIGTAAVLALVRHTVAAKLFTKELLKHHVDFCIRLAQCVEISRLRYPHRPASLEQAQELLFPQHRNVALDIDSLD